MVIRLKKTYDFMKAEMDKGRFCFIVLPIIEESETTVVVPPDYAVNTDNDLNLVAQLKSID